ncbi:hypothetical protein [Gordonia sihwensis]|uniref:hypothetical protein n=1 Tax=Gordonia sihwensis TaxID=173559 RepID=UPI0005F05211|nr:hypothetical protein [Gordonia sihwensis]KJR10523.1 hypothetical protein UG54_00565 [Gordonia sihwensis]
MDDEQNLDAWVEKYRGLLQAELYRRGITMPPESADDYVRAMVSSIADSTGVDERQARLYITEDAVRSWATSIENDDEPQEGIVAIPGGLALHLVAWSQAVMQVLQNPAEPVNDRTESVSETDALREEVLQQAILIQVSVFPLPHTSFDLLEAPMPAAAFEDVCDAVVNVAGYLGAALVDELSATDRREVAGTDESPLTVGALSAFGFELIDVLGQLHRHIADLDDLLSYENMDVPSGHEPG